MSYRHNSRSSKNKQPDPCKNPVKEKIKLKIILNLTVFPLLYTMFTAMIFQYEMYPMIRFLWLIGVGFGMYILKIVTFKEISARDFGYTSMFVLIKSAIVAFSITTIVSLMLVGESILMYFDYNNNTLTIYMDVVLVYVIVYAIAAFLSFLISEAFLMRIFGSNTGKK